MRLVPSSALRADSIVYPLTPQCATRTKLRPLHAASLQPDPPIIINPPQTRARPLAHLDKVALQYCSVVHWFSNVFRTFSRDLGSSHTCNHPCSSPPALVSYMHCEHTYFLKMCTYGTYDYMFGFRADPLVSMCTRSAAICPNSGWHHFFKASPIPAPRSCSSDGEAISACCSPPCRSSLCCCLLQTLPGSVTACQRRRRRGAAKATCWEDAC